jgi:hypothetical protein
MFVDEKREGEVTEKPSMKGLIKWLEGQDPQTSYTYVFPEDCLMAHYLKAIGVERYNLSVEEVEQFFGVQHDDIHPAVERPWTYGAALKRIRAFNTNQTPSPRLWWPW